MATRVPDELYQLQAAIAKALSHPTRLRILDVIADDEIPVATLLERTGVSKANLSQHLAVLRASHVLAIRREGRAAYVRLRHPEIKTLCTAMREVLARDLRAEGEQARIVLRHASGRRLKRIGA